MQAHTKAAKIAATPKGFRACIVLNGKPFWASEYRRRRHEAEHDLRHLRLLFNYDAIRTD